jgi:uncharacterized protein (DUF4415 family)
MDELLPYAPLILKLLQGVVYYDDKQWELLISYATPIQRHFAAIGLRLHLDETEGYAYLTQPDEEDSQPLPRLVRRAPLNYDATLLCVLLRESLQQFDAHSPDQPRHVLSRGQIQEMMQLFFAEQTDMTRVARRIDSAIRLVENVTFLKKLNNPDEEELYEVRRIIKAKISADVLVEIREQLKAYQEE